MPTRQLNNPNEQDSVTGGLFDLKNVLNTKVDRLIEMSLAVTPKPDKLPTPPEDTKLPPPPAGTVGNPAPGPVKLLSVLLLAGAACLLASGSPRSEGMPVSNIPHPGTALDCARDALRQGQHAEALRYYLQVCDPTPEALFGRAQCQFRTNDYDGALATCDTLDVVTGGTGWESPLVRGWIAERRGQKVMAYTWYSQSARRGNEGAEKLAARVK